MSNQTLELVRAQMQPLRTPDLIALAEKIQTADEKVWWTTLYKIRTGVTKDPAFTLVERLRLHFGIPAEQPEQAA